MNLHVLKRVIELRNKGLGYRSISKAVCEELRVCVSYRTIARWIKKYSHFILNGGVFVDKVSLAEVTHDDLSSREPVNNPDLDVIKKQWGRLGRTERTVLRVILSEPGIVWTAAMVWRELKLLKYSVSRQAVYQAMKRLAKRGILTRVPRYVRVGTKIKEFRYELFKGEVIRGGFKLIALEPSSFSIHNVRIPGIQVIANDSSVNLSVGLFIGEVLAGEAPLTQFELNSDIPIPKKVLDYLRNRVGWGFTVIYPKPRQGVLRIEHRF